MVLTRKQFAYLNEMGISLWQRKNIAETKQVTEPTALNNTAVVSLAELSNHRVFRDVLLAIGSELSDIEQQGERLILGDISWRFSDDQQLSFNNGELTTPKLDDLSTNADAKQALWQLIVQHQLVTP
ncbi:hypothetical protein tinsulaeT_30300 [Thalassotalea insulae]|uniref:DNA polymerase III subunit psi n=1 Tax=Thalassotalea insulae TaxID=2056778 RepID=A0ABQ6GYW3_9GAMM|nr:DNA polymerase III subunit psi [Thalassotalea insulae]GLX79690.1 hypothetical protein tinsulaeT_30300 [Thalassotalea insulae]